MDEASAGAAEMPLGVEYELRPLPKPVEILVGEVKQEINPRNERPMTVAIEDSYKPELMQDYAYFAPTRTVPMARVYVLPADAAFQPIVDKIRQHGIVVEELKAALTTEVSSFVVEAITKSPKPFQGHNEVKLKGQYVAEKVTLPAGTRIVRLAQPLGLLAAYLLEPESDDGLTNWNFLDQWLEVGKPAPVRKIMANVRSPNGEAAVISFYCKHSTFSIHHRCCSVVVGLLRLRLARVLHVLVEPRGPARPQVEQRLLGHRTVILVRIQIERGRLAQPVQRVIQPDRVLRIGADVLIGQVVIHQQRAGQVVRIEERRHRQVDVRRLPEVAALALEAERRQRAVVGAVAGDPRLEERRVDHGVDGRERAVAVAADRQPRAIDERAPVELVDDRREVVAQVVHVVVVHLPGRSDDRRIGLDDGVAEADEELHRPHPERLERVLVERAIGPVVGVLILELARIEPEDRRQPRPLLIALRQRHGRLELEPVGALDRDALDDGVGDVGRVVLVLRQLRARAVLHQDTAAALLSDPRARR